ncbi:hypothetical protein JCM10914A_25670 [Paenibacillus sp. JCM 10914]|uniref:hypothetical protein n=1 Tax=Paenibacillus sp. JCM 10914 TaxID=1236974 RepID=UPI0003CC8576|nr:hypothetical protein [Paenibacillus sp. JCM 10914]GAE09564.1 hypothetical protein JCM10914_5929 [Paenibacillus sp. JCM 10914]
MYHSRIVTGKVIDIRDGKVVTQQGDMISSYNLRYYNLMNEDLPVEVEDSLLAHMSTADQAEEDIVDHSSGWQRKDWKPLVEFIISRKKSANRA